MAATVADYGDEAQWTTSSFSNGNGGECVTVAAWNGKILVADSKLGPDSPALRMTRSVFGQLVDHATNR